MAIAMALAGAWTLFQIKMSGHIVGENHWASNARVLLGLLVLIAYGYAAISKPSLAYWEAMWTLWWLMVCVGVVLAGELLVQGAPLTRLYGKVWVKALDFPYLLLGFLGIGRLLNASPNLAHKVDNLDSIGMVVVTVALGIRLAKVIIEVFFDWYVELCAKVDNVSM